MNMTERHHGPPGPLSGSNLRALSWVAIVLFWLWRDAKIDGGTAVIWWLAVVCTEVVLSLTFWVLAHLRWERTVK